MKTAMQQTRPTEAQLLFGAKYQNAPILNERPQNMGFEAYRAMRRAQVKQIKKCLHG